MERSQGERSSERDSGDSASNSRADQAHGAIVDAMATDDAPTAMELAIATWLHAKEQRSQSAKTLASNGPTIYAFRALLREQGLDLDAADPRVARRRLRATYAALSVGGAVGGGAGGGAGDTGLAPSAEEDCAPSPPRPPICSWRR